MYILEPCEALAFHTSNFVIGYVTRSCHNASAGVVGAVVIMVLMIGAHNAFASFGFRMGAQDASNNDISTWYILESGSGFEFHSKYFIRDYIAGFCSVAGPSMSSDADQASWDCAQGPDSGSWASSKGTTADTQKEYQSGFKQGMSDLALHKSIKAIAQVIDKHSVAFYEGWLDGHCRNSHAGGSDADELTYDCSDISSHREAQVG